MSDPAGSASGPLVVRGGTVVTARGHAPLDVLIRAGQVAALLPCGEPADAASVDADGLLVLPGFVDTHVHLMEPGDGTREDFPAGTRAALAQGVTTIVEHTHGWPVTTPARLAEKLGVVAGRSWVDYGLAAHVWPGQLAELGPLWRAGIIFFKIFTCDTHGIPGLGTGLLLEALGLLAGLGAPSLIHCEDDPITAAAERRLRALGRNDPWILPEWRCREAELVAVTAACLLLAEDEVGEHGALRKFTPPARVRSNADADLMWAALHDGRVHHVSSDHAPSTRAQKASGSIWDAPFGLPGLDTTGPLLIDAALTGRISLERVVGAYATAPARRYGLCDKGDLRPGCDADLMLVDPGARRVLADSAVRSRAGWTLYAGREVRGQVVATVLHGTVTAWRGEPTGPPGGRFLPGPGAGQG